MEEAPTPILCTRIITHVADLSIHLQVYCEAIFSKLYSAHKETSVLFVHCVYGQRPHNAESSCEEKHLFRVLTVHGRQAKIDRGQVSHLYIDLSVS